MYGFSAPGEPTECVSLRVTTVGRIAKPPLRPLEALGAGPEPKELRHKKLRHRELRHKERRPVYFAETGDYDDCPIYDRYGLPAGETLAGPVVIEEFDSTTVVHPGYDAEVDTYGNLILRREQQ